MTSPKFCSRQRVVVSYGRLSHSISGAEAKKSNLLVTNTRLKRPEWKGLVWERLGVGIHGTLSGIRFERGASPRIILVAAPVNLRYQSEGRPSYVTKCFPTGVELETL